jgi:prepilin-type N-terminal cleavage/methylation domain-containing protein
MSYQQLKKKTEGFTIIEVLIVLAIAGLILLIVFLAVPALQRNSRNTQIKNDAAVVLSYINDYASNHNGALPACVGVDTTDGTVSAYSAGSGTPLVTCSGTATELGKIRSDVDLSTVRGKANSELTTNDIHVGIDEKCEDSEDFAAGSSVRSMGARFRTEAAGSTTFNCLSS